MRATELVRFVIRGMLAGVVLLSLGNTTANGQDYKESYNEALAAANAKDYNTAYQKYQEAADLAKAAGDSEVTNKSLKVLSQLDKIFGSRQYKRGNYEEALTYFNKGIAHNPDYAANYYNKGLALKKLGRVDEAMETLKSAAGMNDRKVAREAEEAIRSHYHSEASRHVAKENPRAADADRALAALAEMESFASPDADSYYYMATAASIKGDYAQAIDFADKALEIHRGGRSDKAKIYFVKAEALMYSGNVDAAKSEFRNAAFGSYKASAEHYIETL